MKFRYIKVRSTRYPFLAHISLNRPPVNALNNHMQKEIAEAFEHLSAEEKISMVLLEVNKCGGADLREMVSEGMRPDFTYDFARMFDAISICKKPIIGVMNGPLIGAGTTLALLCDHTIVSSTSRFGYPECFFGLKPSISAPYAIARMGRANAIHYFSNGQIFGAEVAKQMNIVTEICTPDLLEATLNQRLEQFLESPHSILSMEQSTVKAYEGDDAKDDDMIKMVDKAIELCQDRSTGGRKELVRHTSMELATDIAPEGVQRLINKYLDEQLGRSLNTGRVV